MHRLVAENLERVLNNTANPAQAHVADCAECRDEVAAMREQAALLRTLRAPAADLEPRPGFYARVLERIEASRPVSIWNLFESMYSRRIAFASLTLAALLGVYLISTDEPAEQIAVIEPQMQVIEVLPVPSISGQFVALHDNADVMIPGEPSEDSVLANLVTYREQ